MPQSLTIPAFAADTLGESLTIEAPPEWHDRIRLLSPYVCYGPDFRRAVLYSLRELSRLISNGNRDLRELAASHLVYAEDLIKREATR